MSLTSVSSADREHARLEALRRYAILDTPPEKEFDELVRQAARDCGYPIAMLTLMDEHRCWFKATTGLTPRAAQIRELPRDQTFCNHAFGSSGIFVVPDARADARFSSLPVVDRPNGFRAYAGAQLITPDGHSIGTLCLLDEVQHQPTAEQRATLRRFADRAMKLLEERQREFAPAASVALAPPHPADAARARELVLVVDDEDLVRGVTAAMLKCLGHETRLAANGREALDCIAAESGRVRLVVTDIHMPVMNGLELVDALRRLTNAPAVVAMSGKFTEEICTQLRAGGVSAMFAKPFSMADIVRALEQVRATAG